MQKIYGTPELYHYGFSFRDTKKEASVLVAASDLFGNGGRCFLEVACGNCPYALDLISAGVEYHGLDLSPEMLRFSAKRIRAAAGQHIEGQLHLADMREFSLPKRFDLVFVLMGSLHYLNNDELLQHLDSVYLHMNPGGLYILEGCILYSPSTQQQSIWSIDSPLGDISVSWTANQKSDTDYVFEEKFDISVDGKLMASNKGDIYLRNPDEFKLLLQTRESQWEIVDSFNDWNLELPVTDSRQINRPLCILRKKTEQ